jgi:hypothetical protein
MVQVLLSMRLAGLLTPAPKDCNLPPGSLAMRAADVAGS